MESTDFGRSNEQIVSTFIISETVYSDGIRELLKDKEAAERVANFL